MYQLSSPLRPVKLLAAIAGIGALAALGIMSVIDGGEVGVRPLASEGGATSTVTTPPTAPVISFAKPTVKAPHT